MTEESLASGLFFFELPWAVGEPSHFLLESGWVAEPSLPLSWYFPHGKIGGMTLNDLGVQVNCKRKDPSLPLVHAGQIDDFAIEVGQGKV